MRPRKIVTKRAVGGYLAHLLLDTGTDVALCGFQPGQRKEVLRVHRSTRARWSLNTAPCVRDCPRCRDEAAKLAP